MLQTQSTGEPEVQLLYVIGMAIVFAALGTIRTYHSAKRKHGEAWTWSKAKYEIVAVGIAGGAAGVYVFTIGASPLDPIFGAAVTVAGLIGREAYLIASDSHDRYGELREADVEPLEAAVLSIQHGYEANDPEEVFAGLSSLLNAGGQPSRAKMDESARETRSDVAEEGVGALFPEEDAYAHVDDIGDPAAPRTPNADTESESESESPTPSDEGEHYADDGDQDGHGEEGESEATQLPPG